MTSSTFTVAGMTCDHCVSAVREEIGSLEGVERVDVDLATGAVVVTSAQPVDHEAVQEAVDEAGYEMVGPNGAEAPE